MRLEITDRPSGIDGVMSLFAGSDGAMLGPEMDSRSPVDSSGSLFLCFFFLRRLDVERGWDEISADAPTSSDTAFATGLSSAADFWSGGGGVTRGVGSLLISFFFFLLRASKGSILGFFLIEAPLDSSSLSESCFAAPASSSSPLARLLPLPERCVLSRSVSREELAASGMGAPTPSLYMSVL